MSVQSTEGNLATECKSNQSKKLTANFESQLTNWSDGLSVCSRSESIPQPKRSKTALAKEAKNALVQPRMTHAGDNRESVDDDVYGCEVIALGHRA
jgi:hypothetical protein